MIPAVFIAVLLAQIEGQVVNAITGAPLKKAAVLIESDNGRRYVESTDAAGKFKFEEIEPGEYNLSAERVGFLKSASESDITAAAGETVKGIVLKLTPASVIAGRVIDEDGDPVPGAQVAIRRYSSKREILTEGLEANGEGGFIFTGLKPGRYILSATKLGDGPVPQPGRQRAEEAFTETFYPNAVDRASSVPIDLKPGSEFRGLEFRLRKERVFRIRGKIVGADSDEPLKLTLYFRDRPGSELSASTRGGSFEFANVPAGSYSIRVDPTQTSFDRRNWTMSSKRAKLFCNYAVNVGGKNLDDLVVPLNPGATITGRIIAGGMKFEKNPHVSLEAVDNFVRPIPEADASPEGTFQMASIPFEQFRVLLGPLPKGAYVKSIRFDSRELIDRRVDLSSGAGGAMEIVIAPNAGEIGGVARKPNGDVAAKAGVYAWINDSHTPWFARAGKDGTFTFENLAPGDYHVAAMSSADVEENDDASPNDGNASASDGVAILSVDTVDSSSQAHERPFDDPGTLVKVHEGSRELVELKLVTTAAANR